MKYRLPIFHVKAAIALGTSIASHTPLPPPTPPPLSLVPLNLSFWHSFPLWHPSPFPISPFTLTWHSSTSLVLPVPLALSPPVLHTLLSDSEGKATPTPKRRGQVMLNSPHAAKYYDHSSKPGDKCGWNRSSECVSDPNL
ncbi:hypothetical protein Pcinc_038837 [Petrolisthes cinctipes]|uniref:Uncharacterized protein n=1 Tax=Petrolisthes cinctipes TaxID=88211 RepID=A0AAE1BQ19_PETCI|nr:hypothetical protein Pcinc_038837 [Petrolisthes cinctipes]